MAEKRICQKYRLSVEGETEKWYFDWLCDMIKKSDEAKCDISIKPTIQQSPMKYAKGLNSLMVRSIYHICDVESLEPVHVEKFQNILSEMKAAKTQKLKKVDYKLGYSNFTFELWIVLHKKDCNGSLAHRSKYLSHINKAFGENFEDLDHFKAEDNFKRCLSKLTLNDVKMAIHRAERIMISNAENGKKEIEFKGFKYYEDNPSLTIWTIVKEMLMDCGIKVSESKDI